MGDKMVINGATTVNRETLELVGANRLRSSLFQETLKKNMEKFSDFACEKSAVLITVDTNFGLTKGNIQCTTAINIDEIEIIPTEAPAEEEAGDKETEDATETTEADESVQEPDSETDGSDDGVCSDEDAG